MVALASDETDEMEEEREVRDVSEIIDSGEDAVEIELARDERRAKLNACGDVAIDIGGRSKNWAALTVLAWAIASPIELPFPRLCGKEPAAGVESPLD